MNDGNLFRPRKRLWLDFAQFGLIKIRLKSILKYDLVRFELIRLNQKFNIKKWKSSKVWTLKNFITVYGRQWWKLQESRAWKFFKFHLKIANLKRNLTRKKIISTAAGQKHLQSKFKRSLFQHKLINLKNCTKRLT